MNAYYQLTKPGIVYGNAIPAIAAFLYASHGVIDWYLCIVMLLGLSLVVASAGALNNYIDRDIDGLMERTKNRPLPSGQLTAQKALIYGILLGVAGGALLAWYVNILAFSFAALGWALYLFCYTPLKRRSPYALFVGALAGAVPPVVGYVAVGATLDVTALLLFLFLFAWQIPHFLAIAVYRNEDYEAAGIPLFLHGPFTKEQKRIARITFYTSLIVLLGACLILIVQR